ncbi:MAG: hypothetical protein HQL91_04850 [Magnetococcales bacterium]|nr:hypothetical protein [Magnetococcales bacterium]
MAEERDSWEMRLSGLLRLVREKRLDEAGTLLESLILAAPEVAARWLVLSRLIALDPSRWDQDLQTALGQLGGAPLTAYRRAIRVLDEARAETEAIHRLEMWSLAVTGACHAAPAMPGWMTALDLWLSQLKARRAQWRLMAPARRTVTRLERLADRLETKAVRDESKERILSRLEQLRGAWHG